MFVRHSIIFNYELCLVVLCGLFENDFSSDFYENIVFSVKMQLF